MSQTITQGRLRINANFKRFVDEEVLPGTGLDAAAFWRNFDEIVHDLAPENRQLLAERDRIQAALDEWHRSNPGPVKDKAAYKSFLRELGYLVPQPERVTVETTGIDSEITSQAGPQLVVPAMNARYALNAANARWGSLYDALYGSDIIPQEGAMVSGYDPQRGEQVIEQVTLMKPNAGTLRGVSLAAVANSEVDALIKVLPRMTAPMLTEQEVAALELPDLVALAGKVVGFLSPNSVQ